MIHLYLIPKSYPCAFFLSDLLLSWYVSGIMNTILLHPHNNSHKGFVDLAFSTLNTPFQLSLTAAL